MRDVFTKGDAWYRSGDIFTRDAKGYYYFVDKLGDTFRWKGENVSALEVAQSISSFPGTKEAAVYGVAVPGCEGRAGMAAISIDAAFDLVAFSGYLKTRLPLYAQPLFMRVVRQLELTSTFRPKKFRLVSEGFDPNMIGDPLYFNNHKTGEFEAMGSELHKLIISGKVRV